ncbi:MAG: immunoglobulin-like domain-containing protein, partial [Bacteroidota bacterium]
GFNATKQRKVVVMDTTKPTIVTNAGTISINHQVGTPYMDPIKVNDNYWKGIVPTRTGVINPGIPGSYSLIYNAVDGSGNIALTYYVSVMVKDLVPPAIKLVGQNPLTVDVHTAFNDPGVETSDNYYPNVTTVRTGLPTMNLLGDYLVTYTATDGAGNTATVTRLVKVVDRIAPEIELLGANPFVHPRFMSYEDPGIKIKDNYYADSTLQKLVVKDFTKLDVTHPGMQIITFRVTDPSNNISMKMERYVHVVEVTGISELSSNSSLSIYPNPSKGLFTITNKTNSNISAVQVMDAVGKTVYTKPAQSAEVTVDLTTVNKGLYFVIIKDESGKEYSSKIMVE